MAESTKKLARASLGAALGFVILYLAAVLPSARLAVACISTVCVIFVRMTCGLRWALGCYVVTAALALLLLPLKGVALLYAAFVGYYPLVKLWAERLSRPLPRWCVKLAVFNAALALLFFLARTLLAQLADVTGWSALLVFAAANAVFFVYDLALSKLILIYMRKLGGRLK